MPVSRDHSSTMDWLLPLLGGVFGAATPGLSRGIGVAAMISNAIQRHRMENQKAEDQNRAREAAMRLAGMFGNPTVDMAVPGQGGQTLGFAHAGSQPPRPDLGSILAQVGQINPGAAATFALNMQKPGLPPGQIGDVAQGLPPGSTAAMPIEGGGGTAYIRGPIPPKPIVQKPPPREKLIAIVGDDGRPVLVPESEAVGKRPWYKPPARSGSSRKAASKQSASSGKAAKGPTITQLTSLMKTYEKRADALEEQADMQNLYGNSSRAQALMEAAQRAREKAMALEARLDEMAGLAEPEPEVDSPVSRDQDAIPEGPPLWPAHEYGAGAPASGRKATKPKVIRFDAAGNRIQ